MSEPTIEAHKIETPINLLAVWFVALILLVGACFGAATQFDNWIAGFLTISSVTLILLFVFLIYRMQTVHRAKLLPADQYLEYVKQEFENFSPENLEEENNTDLPSETNDQGEAKNQARSLEERRMNRYEKNYNLFLTHNWRPSTLPKQVADISIQLYQHWKGPLTEGKIKSVEYQLGPKFFKRPMTKTNVKENFRLDVSAYGPMLCTARINFTDDREPIILERYINFAKA